LIKEGLNKAGSFQKPPVRNGRVDILQEVINMTHCQTQEVIHRTLTQEKTEANDHPWEIGSSEIKETKEAHRNIPVPSAPDVHNRKGETRRKKE